MVEKLVKINEDDEHLTAKGIHYMELSTTPTPGIIGTSLKQAMQSFQKDNKFTKPINESFELIKETEEVDEDYKLTEEEIKQIEEETESAETIVGEDDASEINTQEEQLPEEKLLEVETNIRMEDTKMVEETKTVEKVETVAEVKEVTAPQFDASAIVEALSAKIDEKLDTVAKEFNDKLVALKEELEEEKPEEAPAVEPAKEKEAEVPAEKAEEEPAKEKEAPSEPEFKSEEPKSEEPEAKEESAGKYCIEKIGNGKYAMFVMPNAIGELQ